MKRNEGGLFWLSVIGLIVLELFALYCFVMFWYSGFFSSDQADMVKYGLGAILMYGLVNRLAGDD